MHHEQREPRGMQPGVSISADFGWQRGLPGIGDGFSLRQWPMREIDTEYFT